MNRSAELQLGAAPACPERAELEVGAPSPRFMDPKRATSGVSLQCSVLIWCLAFRARFTSSQYGGV
jgi:hypothetical protein